MPTRCTCGAQLVENAAFCHICGRPVHDPPPLVEEPEPEKEGSGGSRQSPETAPVTFGNPAVLRAANLPAILAAIFGSLPYLGILCFLWYPAAGFAAVYLYRRLTGIFLTPRQGAKLGWITGLLSFAVALLVSTIGYVLGGGADLSALLQEAIQRSGQPDEMQRRMLDMIRSPAMLAAMFLGGLLARLVSTAGLTMLGGVIGAKVLEKDD